MPPMGPDAGWQSVQLVSFVCGPPAWFVPVGYALSSMANGLFSWLISEVSSIGLSVDPWRSLVVGLAVALAAYFVLIALMRRSTDVTLSRSTT